MDQLLALEQPELVARDVPDGQPEGAGVLAAARAVAVIRVEERFRDLKTDAAAETASLQRFPHALSLC